jgi:diguanylate cyclase (GGDEF)-like protein
MFNFLANCLVAAGICILVGAMIPVSQLIEQIPSGPVRLRWRFIAVLIIAFITGYVSYMIAFWGSHSTWLALMVPGIFFFGAGFVWITVSLALQTAADIRRVVLLEQENITDPLMGIYNRRYLDRRLEEEYSRARRYEMPLSVLLLDIDHFKQVNDTYGHPIGDQVLIYLGKLLLNGIRETDIVARYGGEELLIIAPNTGPAAAAALAERLRQHIETHALIISSELSQRQEIRIKVSIGVASLSNEIKEGQQLVGHADEAMYRAKQEGRNRVVTYSLGMPGRENSVEEQPLL